MTHPDEDLEVAVPRLIGPTIPRWQLGEQLAKYREAAGINQKAVAERLACSVSKVQKIEGGTVKSNLAEVEALLDMYGITDSEKRDHLLELHRLGRQRGWWSAYGQLPTPFADFLGIESAASSIRVFEPMMVYGLVQTKEYAYAHEKTVTPNQTPAQIERQVQLRLDRQAHVLDVEEGRPEMWLVFDESVIRRTVGNKDVMRGQLEHLLKLVEERKVTIQIVPFARGGYPGVLGGLTIFDFPERLHSPVTYVECQAGNLYMEKETDLRRCTVAYTRILATALSPEESVELVADAARSMR